jgi:hypothetical protein
MFTITWGNVTQLLHTNHPLAHSNVQLYWQFTYGLTTVNLSIDHSDESIYQWHVCLPPARQCCGWLAAWQCNEAWRHSWRIGHDRGIGAPPAHWNMELIAAHWDGRWNMQCCNSTDRVCVAHQHGVYEWCVYAPSHWHRNFSERTLLATRSTVSPKRAYVRWMSRRVHSLHLTMCAHTRARTYKLTQAHHNLTID